MFARPLLCAVLACFSLALAIPAAAQDRPATLGLGAGLFDVTKNEPRDRAADFRLEYRFADSFVDNGDWLSVRPWMGAEVSSDGMVYGIGGVLMDVSVGNLVFTPSFGAGLHYDGNGKQLGSAVEFRSPAELAYRFSDESRLGISFGHISNAGLTEHNPGAEIVTIYYHLPTHWLFGR